MSPSVEHANQTSSDTLASTIAAWSELKSYLDHRSRELSEEVRHYPTPIAHCDEQLPKLIEQRTSAINQLKRLNEAYLAQSSPAGGRRLAALEEFLADPQAFPDDETETALRSRLRAALSRFRDKE
jgi:hypothetical protein